MKNPMKKKYLMFVLSVFPLLLQAQDSNQNYIKTATTLEGSQQLVTIQYYDGIGRPFEKVEKNITPNHDNKVFLTEYDALGRQYRQWLPAMTNVDYLASSSIPSTASSTHGGDTRPFTENVYDGSPLNRIVCVKTAGAAWASTPIKTEHLTNTSTFPLCCKDYVVQGNNLQDKGLYANATLYVTKTKDMASHVNYVFTDVNGHKILERQMFGNTSCDTYYVYDQRSDLRFVLQPMYQEEQDINKFAFCYRYDNRHRIIEKKLPGAESVKYGYDTANRLVFSQDGRQQAAGKASFMLYDKLNRMVVKGTCNLAHISFLPVACTDATLNAGAGNVGQTGYSSTLTLETPLIESASYYDTYNFLGHDAFTTMDFTVGSVSARGNLTGDVSFLNSIVTPCLCTVYHYDIKGRNVKTLKNNTVNGKETITTTYSITDKPLTVEHKIKATKLPNGQQEMTERTTYTYDHADRLTRTTHQLDDNTPVVLADNGYDNLCRLSSKTVMGEKISYSYNIKDWITQISSNNFIQQLTYLANGNIGSNYWKYGNASNFNIYSYAYDALGRICNATHIIPGHVTTRSLYSTSYSYDRNGNITRLYRNAPMTDGTMGVMDRLDMAYDGNHLISAINSSNADDFMDCVRYEGKNDMEYDENGCLTKDLDKKISSIRYNSLNLPTTIDFRRDYYNTYMYNSKGQKVKEVKHMPLFELAEMNHLVEDVPKGVQGVTGHLYHENEFSGETSLSQAPPLLFSDITYTIDYSDNLVFEDGKLKRILLDEGFIYFENNNTPTYHYYLKDHQGNNRAVVSAATKQKEENYDYYPFGKQFGDYHTGNIHPYRYNGKELDKINGLDWYYYGARMMEPAWGRFTTPDPLAEDYYSISPYVYCLNNPIKNIDPDGRIPLQVITGVVGAIGGAAIEGYLAYVSGKSSKEIWGAAGRGAIEGAVLGVTMGASTPLSISGSAAISAAGSAAGSTAEQLITEGNVETDNVVTATVAGAIGGALGAGGTKVVNNVAEKAVARIDEKYASTSMQKKIKDEVINSGAKKSNSGICGHSSKTNTNTKVAKIARARKSNEKTDVKIKQTTADAVQQYSLGKIAGAIVDFGRRLFD